MSHDPDNLEDVPEPEELSPEAKPEGPGAPVEQWVFFALVAIVTGAPLPKRKPDGAADYVASLLKQKPNCKAFRGLYERLKGKTQ